MAFPATGHALGPDGLNHSSAGTAYGPLAPSTAYPGTYAYNGDKDFYVLYTNLPNAQMVVNFADTYTPSPGDQCSNLDGDSACNLTINVLNSQGVSLLPYQPSFNLDNAQAVAPGGTWTSYPITLPTSGAVASVFEQYQYLSALGLAVLAASSKAMSDQTEPAMKRAITAVSDSGCLDSLSRARTSAYKSGLEHEGSRMALRGLYAVVTALIAQDIISDADYDVLTRIPTSYFAPSRWRRRYTSSADSEAKTTAY